MATTQREKLLLSIVAVLNAAPTGAGVYRSRQQAIARNELPAIVVRPGGEQNERLGSGLYRRSFQVLIEVHACSDSTPGAEVAADQAADPVIAAVNAALYADKTFGRQIADLIDKEMQEPQFADGDETRVGITLVYEALYATRETDITSRTNH